MTRLSGIAPADMQGLRLLHEQRFGVAVDEWQRLRGDGSDRMIVRLRSSAGSCIGVVGPNLEENRAFIGFTRSFHAAGLPVPEMYAVDQTQRLYLEEDLGDETLATWQESQRDGDAFPPQVLDMYLHVLRTLVRFQIDAADTVDYGLCYQTAEFAGEAMMADLAYFRSRFVGQFFLGTVDDTQFDRDAVVLVSLLLSQPRSYFLYRDFQSRNVMITDGGPRFIDYQSGRRGALQYDAASLLYDSRGNLTGSVRQLLLRAYMDEVRQRIELDEENFLLHFDGFAILRLLQALGAFGRLGVEKKKGFFLPLIPSRLRNLSTLVHGSRLMEHVPYLHRLLLDLCEKPDLLAFPEQNP